jgi:hypothetical protein
VVRMNRPMTEAPETQIYFITHRSGAFLKVRLRTVVRGERTSGSIFYRTTAARSLGVVASLILADLGLVPIFVQKRGREVAEPRGAYGVHDLAQ